MAVGRVAWGVAGLGFQRSWLDTEIATVVVCEGLWQCTFTEEAKGTGLCRRRNSTAAMPSQQDLCPYSDLWSCDDPLELSGFGFGLWAFRCLQSHWLQVVSAKRSDLGQSSILLIQASWMGWKLRTSQKCFRYLGDGFLCFNGGS